MDGCLRLHSSNELDRVLRAFFYFIMDSDEECAAAAVIIAAICKKRQPILLGHCTRHRRLYKQKGLTRIKKYNRKKLDES